MKSVRTVHHSVTVECCKTVTEAVHGSCCVSLFCFIFKISFLLSTLDFVLFFFFFFLRIRALDSFMLSQKVVPNGNICVLFKSTHPEHSKQVTSNPIFFSQSCKVHSRLIPVLQYCLKKKQTNKLKIIKSAHTSAYYIFKSMNIC